MAIRCVSESPSLYGSFSQATRARPFAMRGLSTMLLIPGITFGNPPPPEVYIWE